jgi:hypothetical protein
MASTRLPTGTPRRIRRRHTRATSSSRSRDRTGVGSPCTTRVTVRDANGDAEKRWLATEIEFRDVLRGEFGLNMSDSEIDQCNQANDARRSKRALLGTDRRGRTSFGPANPETKRGREAWLLVTETAKSFNTPARKSNCGWPWRALRAPSSLARSSVPAGRRRRPDFLAGRSTTARPLCHGNRVRQCSWPYHT